MQREQLMKHIFYILILVTVTVWGNDNETRAFIWADDEAYWPAIYRGGDGRPAGIFNEVVTEIFKRLDIPLKKSVYPWKRAQEMVKNGEADGMVTVYTKERAEFTLPTDPIWEISEILFFRRDNPKACKILKINSFDNLKGFSLVDTQGAGWTKQNYKKYGIDNITWVPSTDSALNMLAKGRVDIFIMFDMNAYNLLAKKRVENSALSEGFQNIVAITPPFTKLPFQLLIRKDSPFVDKIDAINQTLKEIKKDGTYQRILQKYIGMMPPTL